MIFQAIYDFFHMIKIIILYRQINECGGQVSIFDLFENHLISQLKPATDRFRPGTLER
jgi:hypothetical protein